ncbi:tyrosine-type recombinase/integrase [Paenibacillus pasadenensis]|uniref:tyrosine-type recombinase/integrase n=1 Tax=Paenibacillus pasadenensis TaxID=217090 RepID=UPI0006937797|nr:tyrosine-type recombinase/integrase [Paenibacillus pasadenensis]
MGKGSPFPEYDFGRDQLNIWIKEYVVYLDQEGAGEIVKAERMLNRFCSFVHDRYGKDQLSILMPRDTKAFQTWLHDKEEDGGCNYSPSYINSHLVALGQFFKWVMIRQPGLLQGNPMKNVSIVRARAEPEAKALTPRQIISLKNTADRLPLFRTRKNARPFRDRAIAYVFLSAGVRRHELTGIDAIQVVPSNVEELRKARRAKIVRVRGKRKTERTVFLSAETRSALADYLEKERPLDAVPGARALFLSAGPSEDKRLHPRSINKILDYIGRVHDANFPDPERRLHPLAPHDLRHTCASELRRGNPDMTDQDLMTYMGWSDKEQIARYTKAQEEVMASFVERMD